MNTITIAVPLSMRADANEFACAIGQSDADRATFAHGPNAVDQNGAQYIVTSGAVGPSFADAALTEPLPPREWAFDLDAATRAQRVVAIGAVASPTVIAAHFAPLSEALAAMGLTLWTEDAL